MQKSTPFLWFEDKAEEAVQFYTSIFKNSKVGRIARYGDAGPGPKGQVMVVDFQIAGQEFVALNGGPTIQIHAGDHQEGWNLAELIALSFAKRGVC